MKYIPLLFVFLTMGGCAKSTDLLHAEAMGCKGELVIEPNGIVRDPTAQEKSKQCKPFWDVYNKRLESIAKQEELREAEEAGSCPDGYVKICDWNGCGCMSDHNLKELLRGMRRY